MLTRLKEIAYDTVAKKFVARDQTGKKVEVPLQAPDGVGDYLSYVGSVDLSGPYTYHDLKDLVVTPGDIEVVGDSLAWGPVDPAYFYETDAVLFKKSGVYVATLALISSVGNDKDASIRVRFTGPDVPERPFAFHTAPIGLDDYSIFGTAECTIKVQTPLYYATHLAYNAFGLDIALGAIPSSGTSRNLFVRLNILKIG